MKAKRASTSMHLLGWIPDLPDHRDFLYAALRPAGVRLPTSVDLRPSMSPVENQGQLGSCTANALAGALEFLEMKSGQSFVDLSRLFIYYNERAVEHTISSDSGAMIRDGIKTLASLGVCPEKKWPYVISAFTKKPSAACYTDAKNHTISTYHRIASVGEMRACLAEGYPFVFGFSVYETFESPAVARTGVLNMPKPRERQLGGHAVCAVGYDDKAKRLLVRNSWGPDWGMKGYFTMPYDYVANSNLSDDFWTIRA
ncbi:MAG TPA: C1 family peptidase [Polyangia bacterium]